MPISPNNLPTADNFESDSMKEQKTIAYNSRRGQEMILVLSALESIRGVSRKTEVIDYIVGRGWISVSGNDRVPYEGQSEPRFRTLLAYARKDAVEKGYMFDSGYDCWEITRDGLSALKRARGLFSCGDWSVSECFLWACSFKLQYDPNYLPSSKDAKHPHTVYEELFQCLY
jgi:hypothetical protein